MLGRKTEWNSSWFSLKMIRASELVASPVEGNTINQCGLLFKKNNNKYVGWI